MICRKVYELLMSILSYFETFFIFVILLNYTAKCICVNQILQENNFIPGVGNFAQEFSPEGVAFDIFFCKNVKSPPLARPPPPSGLTLIGALIKQ